jgi:hypothetical protein
MLYSLRLSQWKRQNGAHVSGKIKNPEFSSIQSFLHFILLGIGTGIISLKFEQVSIEMFWMFFHNTLYVHGVDSGGPRLQYRACWL